VGRGDFGVFRDSDASAATACQISCDIRTTASAPPRTTATRPKETARTPAATLRTPSAGRTFWPRSVLLKCEWSLGPRWSSFSHDPRANGPAPAGPCSNTSHKSDSAATSAASGVGLPANVDACDSDSPRSAIGRSLATARVTQPPSERSLAPASPPGQSMSSTRAAQHAAIARRCKSLALPRCTATSAGKCSVTTCAALTACSPQYKQRAGPSGAAATASSSGYHAAISSSDGALSTRRATASFAAAAATASSAAG